MLNRWDIKIERGLCAKVHCIRGGHITGIIGAVWRQQGLGWRVDIGAATYGIDDVMQTWPVRLIRTRIEVPSPRNGRPGYRWTTGYYVVGPDCHRQFPPLNRKEAYESARQQWPGCHIAVQEDC